MSPNPFRIADPRTVPNGGEGGADQAAEGANSALERVEAMVTGAPVFLFMKGVPAAPRCGFSANAVGALDAIGVSYTTFDVLGDQGVRAAAKEYAQWPTFPQLWVGGELLGGHDIMMEMYQTGELERMLREAVS